MSNVAHSLISKAIAFFDVVGNSRIDYVSEGKKSVYRDPLGNLIQPLPTEFGHNRYDIHGAEEKFRQEIHFQNGSPAQGINGVSNEAIIAVVLHRLVRQNESYPSAYNVLAINLLQGAISALHSRVKDRADFGIYDKPLVEPENKDDAELAKALSIVNSLGILGDVIIKFDAAYQLASPGRIQNYVNNLANYVDQNSKDLSLVSAFSLSSTAVMGSGIFRGFAAIGSEMLKTLKEVQSGSKDAEDNSTDNAM